MGETQSRTHCEPSLLHQFLHFKYRGIPAEYRHLGQAPTINHNPTRCVQSRALHGHNSAPLEVIQQKMFSTTIQYFVREKPLQI